MQKDTVKTSVVTLLAAVHYHKEEIVRDTRDALKAVEELPGGEQEMGLPWKFACFPFTKGVFPAYNRRDMKKECERWL